MWVCIISYMLFIFNFYTIYIIIDFERLGSSFKDHSLDGDLGNKSFPVDFVISY